MKHKNLTRAIAFLACLTYGQALYCQPLYDHLGNGIIVFLISVFLSTLLQALVFYWLFKNISLSKAFSISIIGSVSLIAVSGIALAIIIEQSVRHRDVFDKSLAATVVHIPFIIKLMLVYLLSCIIELLILRVIFKYPFRQLLIPISAGNFLLHACSSYFIVLIFK
jgi:hypothetical protein